MDERVNLILNTVAKGADSLASTVKQLRLLRTQVIGVVNVIKEITAYTDRYISSQNVLNNALGNTTEKLDKYTQSLAKMTGISTVNISEKTALFANMAKSLGMANDVAEDFVIQLDDMSAKMALLYGGGKGFENYAKAMLDAVKGESSTLATMTGIVLKTASLQNTLDELGIDLQAKSLNGASRAMVQYITIARQMNATNADLQKSANNVAWQKQLLKNQIRELALAFSNLLYPILKAILPVLNGILIAITTIINTLSRLFGITDTITDSVVASTNAVNDLGDGVVSTSNKIKRSLRGFDKLNNITTPTPTSSSAGTGAGIDPRILEEFAKMQDNLLNIKTRAHEIAEEILTWLGFVEDTNGKLTWQKDVLLRNIWNWWNDLTLLGKIFVGLGLVATIVSIYSAIKKVATVIKSAGLVKTVTALFGAIKPKNLVELTKGLTTLYPVLSRVIGITVGFIDIFQGGKNIAEGLKSISNEGWNLNNTLKMLIGTIEILSGLALVAGVLTGNPVLITVGAIGTLTGVVGELATKLGLAKDGVYDLETSMDYGNGTLKKYNENIEKLKRNVKDATSEIYAKTGRAQELAREISNLYDENGKLIGSDEELAQKVHTLNDLLGTNYTVTKDGNIMIDDRTVATNELIDTVKKYCQQLRVQAELEAYYDLYVERAKKKIELEKEIKERTDDLTKAQEGYNMETEEGVKKYLSDNAKKISELNKLQGELEKNEDALSNYEKAAYNASIGQYDTAHEYLTRTQTGIETGITETVNKLIQESDRIPDALKKDMNKINDLSATVKIKVNTSELDKILNGNFSLNVGYGGGGGRGGAFAEGGFVDSASIFIAHENGIPEMVGRIGNRTAVANNDQIVEAVASGVSRAINTSKLGSGTTYVKAVFGSDEVTDWVVAEKTKRDRQYGF